MIGTRFALKQVRIKVQIQFASLRQQVFYRLQHYHFTSLVLLISKMEGFVEDGMLKKELPTVSFLYVVLVRLTSQFKIFMKIYNNITCFKSHFRHLFFYSFPHCFSLFKRHDLCITVHEQRRTVNLVEA